MSDGQELKYLIKRYLSGVRTRPRQGDNESSGEYVTSRELYSIRQAVRQSFKAYFNFFIAHKRVFVQQTDGQQRVIRALREIDNLKYDFVTNIEHELRVPLQSIMDFTRMMLYGNDQGSQRQQELLQITQKQSEQLAILIDDLLALSTLAG